MRSGRRLGWLVVLALAHGGCAADEPNPAIPDEVRRSLALVEGDLAMFDELLGEPDYQATTDERCLDGDLYETRSYAVEGVDPMLDEVEAVFDDLRRELAASGWELDAEDESIGSSALSIRGSARRGDHAFDVSVSFHGSPSRHSISITVLFSGLADELCPSS